MSYTKERDICSRGVLVEDNLLPDGCNSSRADWCPKATIKGRKILLTRADRVLIGNLSSYQRSRRRAQSAAEKGEVPKFHP